MKSLGGFVTGLLSTFQSLWRFGRPLGLLAAIFSVSIEGFAHSVNKVYFERRPDGLFRVIVNYTVPGLREYREAFVDFSKRAEAEKAYWSLAQGADFYIRDASTITFQEPTLKPVPW